METIEQKTEKKVSVLYGKKTIMFEIEMADVKHLAELHRLDKNGYMLRFCLKDMSEDEALRYIMALLVAGEIRGWSVYNKNGRKSSRIGFIYLSSISNHSANLSGIMDTKVVRGLGKKIKDGKYTFAEDSLRTVIDHCFDGYNFHRLNTMVNASNRRALALDKKVGWKIEGTQREAYSHNGEAKDVIMLGILKKEWSNG